MQNLLLHRLQTEHHAINIHKKKCQEKNQFSVHFYTIKTDETEN